MLGFTTSDRRIDKSLTEAPEAKPKEGFSSRKVFIFAAIGSADPTRNGTLPQSGPLPGCGSGLFRRASATS